MNKSIFSTRFKKCYQDKGWTQDRVAMELKIGRASCRERVYTPV